MLVKPEEVGLSSSRLARIGEHFQRYVDAGKVAGTLTLVARGRKVAYLEAQGHLEIERRRPVTPESIFRIYSMTKPITSVGLMMLYEQGRFQLDDPVHRFIPSWRDLRVYVGGNHPAWKTAPVERPMTIRDLLSHTSGLTYGFMERTNVDAAYRKLGVADRTRPGATLRDTIATLAELPLEFSPGTRWNYSVATDVVGHLIEVISGQRLDAYLREHVLQPLGMRDTAFHVPKSKRSRLCVAYAGDPKSGKRIVDDHPKQSKWTSPPKVPSASAGLVSTIDDYAKFGRMLLAGGRLGRDRILSRKTIELMTTDFLTPAQRQMLFMGFPMWDAQGFGLGVSVRDKLGGQASLSSIGTYGWGGAYGTWWFNDPKERITAVMMTQLLVGTLGSKLSPDFTNLVYQAIDD